MNPEAERLLSILTECGGYGIAYFEFKALGLKADPEELIRQLQEAGHPVERRGSSTFVLKEEE